MSSPLSTFFRARSFFSQEQIAEHLGREVRTVRRWESGSTAVPKMAAAPLREMLKGVPSAERNGQSFSGPKHFRFIDLFAGIGGTRQAFDAAEGRCVFTSEWDKFAVQTYRANFSDQHEICGDITKIDESEIPEHDVLVAGFPCQPFSLAGVSKKNSLGRSHGFLCEAQGTLFFEVAKILKTHQPKAFLLENVKNLRSHDKGKTFQIIMDILTKELGYHVSSKVIDGKSLVPQHRERIYIVGFREETDFSWDGVDIPEPSGGPRLSSILHSPDEEPEAPYTEMFRNKCRVSLKYTLSDHLWDYLTKYAEKHRAAGNGFGCSVVGPDDVSRTLSARYHKDGSEILIFQGRNKNPRRLTPRECARLMGFPKNFRIPVSDTQAYRQFGNSVVVPVVTRIAHAMSACLKGEKLPSVVDARRQLMFPELSSEERISSVAG